MKFRFNIAKYLKEFNPLSTIKWLNIISAHPNNQLYIQRLEFIMAILFSIPEKSFGRKKHNRLTMQTLFKKTNKDFEQLLRSIEDFEGYDQLNLVPVFIDGDKYYPSYGVLERPIEYFEEFYEMHFSYSSHSKEVSNLKNQFVNSLLFQTNLLLKLCNVKESKYKQDLPYVPSDNMYTSFEDSFSCTDYYTWSSIDLVNFPVLYFGIFSHIKIEALLQKSVELTLFKNHVFKYDEKIYYLHPQLHLNVFYHKAIAIIKKEPDLLNNIYDNFKSRIKRECLKFFTLNNYISALYSGSSEENLLNNQTPFACFVDTNKLFLFCAVHHSLSEDLSSSLEEATANALVMKKLIEDNEIINTVNLVSEEIVSIYTKDIEIWIFPVFDSINFNHIGGLKFGKDMDVVFPFSLMDIKSMFKRLASPLEFLKFLKEEIELRKDKLSPFMGEFMDRFAFYIENGNSYMISGRKVHTVVFEPHTWHYHMLSELHEKYKDSVYDVVEKKFPGFFYDIEQRKEGLYRMVNKAMLDAAYLVRMGYCDIWIFAPRNGWFLSDEDTQIIYELLMPLFGDYLKILETGIKNSREVRSILDDFEYSILIMSADCIAKRQELKSFRNLIISLSADNPIVFDTRIFEGGRLRTVIVYNSLDIASLFAYQSNEGERILITKLLESLYSFVLKDVVEVNKQVFDLISNYIPLGVKGYTLDIMTVRNSYMTDYPAPLSFNKTDMAVANRRISEFLIEKGYLPGSFTGESAKSLNYEVYCYLQKLLESKIAKYKSHVLEYAYAQLELVLGQNELRRLKAGMQAKGRVDYDVAEDMRIKENDASQLNASIQHILHTILKISPDGTDNINAEGWTQLLSISMILLQTAHIYDFIQYDLREHTLEITKEFVLEDTSGEEVIDTELYSTDNIKSKLESAKKAHDKAVEENPQQYLDISNDEKGDSKPEEMQMIDNAFISEYGTSYSNIIFVLYAVSSLQLPPERYFPLTIISIDDLVKRLKEVDKQNATEQELELTIRFLTLRTGIYGESMLVQSSMMKDKERINVLPFVLLDETTILYGNEVAHNAIKFWSKTLYGELPFILPKSSAIQQSMIAIHRSMDLELEQLAEIESKKILGDSNVEARIQNFKRLSGSFKKNEPCGEIDLLCINKDTKTLFVLDAKNVTKRINIYYVRQNIDDFFKGDKSYYSKLLKKKQFISDNIDTILNYFKISNSSDWIVKEGFVANERYFASYLRFKQTNFVLLSDLSDFLTASPS